MAFRVPQSIGAWIQPPGAAPVTTPKPVTTYGPTITAKGPGTLVAPAAPKITPTPGALPGDTSQYNQAALLASQLLNPQIAELNRQAAQRDALAKAQAEEGQSVMAALAHLNSGLGDAVGAAYRQAGQDISSYAGGVTGVVGQQAQSAAAQAADAISRMNAPGTVSSVAPAAMSTAQYLGGFLPARNLAEEAASRLAEAETVGAAGPVSIAQQTLQMMGATNKEAADLRAQGVDLENTRPAEIQKQLLQLRQDQRDQAASDLNWAQFRYTVDRNKQLDAYQQAAAKQKFLLDKASLGISQQNADRAWRSMQETQAANLTNLTGNLFLVDKNGNVYNTGSAAAGSRAGVAQLQAATTQRGQTLSYNARVAADNARNAIDNAKLGISQQQADAATQRAQAYADWYAWKQAHPNASGVGPGGLKQSDIRAYGKIAGDAARAFYYGAKNTKYDPKAKAGTPASQQWQTAPNTAAEALRYMLSHKVPYQIAYDAIKQYAKEPNSRWADALNWQMSQTGGKGGGGLQGPKGVPG